jgi:hypothetical protein
MLQGPDGHQATVVTWSDNNQLIDGAQVQVAEVEGEMMACQRLQ